VLELSFSVSHFKAISVPMTTSFITADVSNDQLPFALGGKVF